MLWWEKGKLIPLKLLTKKKKRERSQSEFRYRKGTYGRISKGHRVRLAHASFEHVEISISCWLIHLKRWELLNIMSKFGSPCEKKNVQDEEICKELVRIFGKSIVDAEWRVCKDASDDIKERYCPVIDFVVGPFNISKDDERIKQMNECYDVLMVAHSTFLKRLHDVDKELEEKVARNLSKDEEYCKEILEVERSSRLIPNINPRCFLAIEFEKETGEKHILGGIVHASGLGKVGIIITLDDNYDSIMRIRRYLRFLVAVRKLGEATVEKNTILLPRSTFIKILNEYEFGLKKFIWAIVLNDEYYWGEPEHWSNPRRKILPQLLAEYIDECDASNKNIGGVEHCNCEEICGSIIGFLSKKNE